MTLVIAVSPVTVRSSSGGGVGGVGPFIVGLLVGAVIVALILLWQRRRGIRLQRSATQGREDRVFVLTVQSRHFTNVPNVVRERRAAFGVGRGVLGLSVSPATVEIWGYDSRTIRRLLTLDRSLAHLTLSSDGQYVGAVLSVSWDGYTLLLLPIRASGIRRHRLAPDVSALLDHADAPSH